MPADPLFCVELAICYAIYNPWLFVFGQMLHLFLALLESTLLESNRCKRRCPSILRMQNPSSERTHATLNARQHPSSHDQHDKQSGSKGRGRVSRIRKSSLAQNKGSIGKSRPGHLKKSAVKSLDAPDCSPSASSLKSDRSNVSFGSELPLSQPMPLPPQVSTRTTQQQQQQQQRQQPGAAAKRGAPDAFKHSSSCRGSSCRGSCRQQRSTCSTDGLSATDWQFLRRLVDSLENDRLQRMELIRRLDRDQEQRQRYQ